MNSAREAAGSHVYHQLKARVIAYEFPQGKRIYLEPIAQRLGVSTTPVREALNRLAAESLVIKAPRKGFIAMTLSESNLIGHYSLTRLLLLDELEKLDAGGRKRLAEYEPFAGVLYRLNRRHLTDISTIANYTGEVFAHIAAFGDNPHVMLSIDAANDQLFYIRTLEAQHLENVQAELICFCELLLASRCDELIAAIQAYHDRRIELLPKLLESINS